VDAAKASTPLGVSDTMCPILGWAEAVNMQDGLHRTDEELLRLLKIDSSPAQVQIDRMAAATSSRSQEPSGGPNQDDRREIFALNTSAILIAAVAVILSGRKAGITGLAVATSVASLLSGPVLNLS
jgi:hypothetical protein